MTGGEAVRGLLKHLRGLDDPRQACKVVYPLHDILLVVLCGTLSGCDDFVEMAAWGRQHLGFLRGFAPFAHGVPSHDTLNDVINALDTDLFEECFAAWVGEVCAGVPDIIALDGKTMRRSGKRRFGMGRVELNVPRMKRVAGRWYWRTTAALKALGFCDEALGDDTDKAIARARDLDAQVENERVRRAGLPPSIIPGSVAALIGTYEASPQFAKLAPKTKQDFRPTARPPNATWEIAIFGGGKNGGSQTWKGPETRYVSGP